MSHGRQAVCWLLAGAAALAAWALFFLWTPPAGVEHSICFFRRMTGVSCPGCGMTRALALLAKGELAAGFRMHPLAPVLAIEGFALWLLWGFAAGRGKSLAPARWPLPLAVAHAGAFVLVWIGRLVSRTLPPG